MIDLLGFIKYLMTSTLFAEVEIQDALLKISLYLGAMVGKGTQGRHEKAVALATETFLKFMDNEEFAKDCYEKAKSSAFKSNYYVLLFVDQMLKNSKIVFKHAKRDLDAVFKIVWEHVWSEVDNHHKLENMKLMARVWGFIFGERCEESIKKFLEQRPYKTKLTISPERE